MMKKNEMKEGDIFTFNKVKLKIFENCGVGCMCCYFKDDEEGCDNVQNIVPCRDEKNGVDIYFKKVKNV